jgi:hypothetical protein
MIARALGQSGILLSLLFLQTGGANGAEPANAGAYSLSLRSYVPTPGRVEGVLLPVRINDGPLLRMLLDTGAENLTLTEKAAQRAQVTTGRSVVLVGANGLRAASGGVADAVAVGPVSFHNVAVNVTRADLGEGLDGILPISIFRGYLTRIDFAKKTLELAPYPETPPDDREGFAPVLPKEHLLFARAVVNGQQAGYVLIDSGSSFTAVSRAAAAGLRKRTNSTVEVRGCDRTFLGEALVPDVRFQFEGMDLWASDVLSMDLATISRFNGVDVTGVLGYPDLRNKVLTVNYRDGLVKIASR